MHLAVRSDQHPGVAAVVAAARGGQRSDRRRVDALLREVAGDVLPAGLELLGRVLGVTRSSEVDRYERAVDRIELRQGACVHDGSPAPIRPGTCRWGTCGQSPRTVGMRAEPAYRWFMRTRVILAAAALLAAGCSAGSSPEGG